MNEENGLFGNANELYFTPVEGESGLDLTLEEDVRLRFVGLVEDRFEQAERARESMTKLVGFKRTTTSVVYIQNTLSLENQKNLKYLLK